MERIVVKFGGSVLRDAEHLRRIVAIVRAYNQPLVIVVSAFFGVTDTLRDALISTQIEPKAGEQAVAWLNHKCKSILRQTANNGFGEEADGILAQRLAVLGRTLKAVNYLGEAPAFAEDIIMSAGERLSSPVVVAALRSAGIECEEALPEELGLTTDGIHGASQIDLHTSRPLVRARIADDKTYIVPGFYGISPHGRVTVLGRGGSDYTAAALAACLNASSVDIWKDVEGFRTADPNLVDNVQPVRGLTYHEAEELAYFGAKILHPMTIAPVVEHDIPVRLFTIHDPINVTEPLTIIMRDNPGLHGRIKGVTGIDDISLLRLSGAGVGMQSGIMAKVTGTLDQQGINIKSILTTQTNINILLARKDIARAAQLIDSLGIPAIAALTQFDTVSLVAVVGEGAADSPEIAAQVCNVLAREQIPFYGGSFGASEAASYFLVERSRRDDAIRAIHHQLCNELGICDLPVITRVGT